MDHRSHPRVVVDRHVSREAGTDRAFVFMYDLSIGGCMLEADDAALVVGQTISIVLATAPQIGTIVWAIGGCVGVRFDKDLHAAVVEYYGFVPTTAQFESIAPKDKFGRPLPPLAKQLG
jgi:hypothetical protein